MVLLGERRQRITESYAAGFLERLEQFSIDVADFPDSIRIYRLARRHRLTFYDAAYLELAQRERVALATLDTALAAAALAEGIALIGVEG